MTTEEANLCPSVRPARRGVAMLMVLAALVVAVTACATLARLAATAAAAQRFAIRRVLADELVRAADVPIICWLNEESANVVLPPEAELPEVDLMFDSWLCGTDQVEIRITAYDQCGMLPVSLSLSPLRMALNPEVAALTEQIGAVSGRGAEIGLDLFPSTPGGRVALFPTPLAVERSVGGGPSGGPSGVLRASRRPLALGALIATHNPGRLLNINTAPMPLVEAALRAQGRGGVEQVVKARSEGKPAAVPPAPPKTASRDVLAPVPTPASHIWSFRIDGRVGPAKLAVWAIYSADSGEWRCVQRLVIDR